MIVHFTARRMEITPEVRAHCEKRLKALEKLMGSVIEVDLILSVQKYRHKVEIHVKAKGAGLIVMEETHDLMNSLNLAFENLEKKVKKEREKWREKKRRKGRARKQLAYPREKEEETPRVVRSDDYSLKPMLLEEALLQFDLEKRDVFLFRKSGSEKWAVIFRRKDGHYGLIDPD
ncbi:MAG: ribosome-associated translation inhibitor RaiA [Candidatus Aminicenantes bacterium]|nr:ribosome-associated translation inhibitor RaiA [Candidatus Aminicenantes bacterium]